MRIAFVSCCFDRVFSSQPVWMNIAAQAPDALVLLGDSTYFDIEAPCHPADMNDFAFAQHAHSRYVDLMAQPDFAALVNALPPGSVHAIWDDHDFLWDGVCGADVHPVHTEKVRLSTAFFEAFRCALAQRFVPGSFPASYNDAAFWNLGQPPLTTPSIALAPGLHLHLSDGRTHRTRTFLLQESKRTLLGPAQKNRFAMAMQAAPNDIHLFASGSTVAGYERYPGDVSWMKGLAANHRMLVLSGDIHRNQLDAFYAGMFPLHEATSSGAAVRDAVVIGAERRNYGILDVDADSLTIRLYKKNKLELQRTLDIATWLPV
jgi:alkaline phosphatase D